MSKILFLDSDDVLYSTTETFCKQYNALSKSKLEVKDLIQFNLYEILEHPIYVDIIFGNPNFFQNLPLKGNHIPEIVEELNREYELYIVTAAYLSSISGKINSFNRDFPFLTSKQIIFSWNKGLLKGDIMIDDAVHNIQGFKNANKQGRAFCVNMPHNKNINEGIDYRIDTLEEIKMYLL